ncbi:MAG TPA: bifunctional folylpolyglutamate synthase/dihydrofolate synthase [Candidatus Eisenbergiella merdipullorum]|uniref:tetrahydrofolate synthase n=1 Tax=Candidatus Eisenbergiella merdipullorum TaxID=2838553 RepID=A0A9D2I6N3_9FIRM|nr:bifunctional folylpolyglutamate synthase/dihydrofolate synthase [Candidatus Eisenbergiella merdipullorum]
MNFQEAMEYVENCKKYGCVPGLDSIRRLLEKLEEPQQKLKYVHIAGTNGKGSVLAMISSVLTLAGYKTGTFSSPALMEERDVFQINRKMISKAEFGRYMERVSRAAEEIASEGFPHPTYFEVETALAFLWFREKGCDIVVVETGMGGLEDATNVIPAPLVCVLSSISMDHMAVLGDTLDAIAAQKAGIIKPGSQVVSIRQPEEAMRVIEETCEKLGCPLTVAEPREASGIRRSLTAQRFSYHGWRDIAISLAGTYQIDNCVLALEALWALSAAGFPVSEEKLRKGLASAVWPGRFQILTKRPLFVVDGAHNEDGAKRLMESVRFYFTNRRIIYIIGILKDKEAEKIIRLTCAVPEAVITTSDSANPRSTPPVELAELIRPFCANVTAADSPQEAVELARLLAGRDGVVVAFGSLSFQKTVIQAVQRDEVRRDNHGKQRED